MNWKENDLWSFSFQFISYSLHVLIEKVVEVLFNYVTSGPHPREERIQQAKWCCETMVTLKGKEGLKSMLAANKLTEMFSFASIAIAQFCANHAEHETVRHIKR